MTFKTLTCYLVWLNVLVLQFNSLSPALAIGSGSLDGSLPGRAVEQEAIQGESSVSHQRVMNNMIGSTPNELAITSSDATSWQDVVDYILKSALSQASIYNSTPEQYLSQIEVLRFTHPPQGFPTLDQLHFIFSSLPNLTRLFFGNNRGSDLGFLSLFHEALATRFVAVEVEYALSEDFLEQLEVFRKPSFSVPLQKPGLANHFILINEQNLSTKERAAFYKKLFPTSITHLPYELIFKICSLLTGVTKDIASIKAVSNDFYTAAKDAQLARYKRILFELPETDIAPLIDKVQKESNTFIKELVLAGPEGKANKFVSKYQDFLRKNFPNLEKITIVHPNHLELARKTLLTSDFPTREDAIVKIPVENGNNIFIKIVQLYGPNPKIEFIKDPQTNEILQFPNPSHFLHGLAAVPCNHNNELNQFLKTDGTYLTAPGGEEPLQFKHALYSLNGFISVLLADNLWRILKPNGTYLKAPGQDKPIEFMGGDKSLFINGFAIIKSNPGNPHNPHVKQFLRPDGTFLTTPQGQPLKFCKAGHFANGFATVGIKIHSGARGPATVYQYLRSDGTFLTAPRTFQALQFDEAESFFNGFAVVKKNNIHHFLRPDGRFLTTPQGQPLHFEEAQAFSDDGIAAVKIQNSWRFLKQDGTFLTFPGRNTPHQFESVKSFTEGFAAVKIRHNLWQYLKRNGMFLTSQITGKPHVFSEEAYHFFHSHAMVKVNGSYQYLRPDGSFLTAPGDPHPLRFNKGDHFTSHHFAPVEVDGLWQLIRSDGTYVSDPGSHQSLKSQSHTVVTMSDSEGFLYDVPMIQNVFFFRENSGGQALPQEYLLLFNSQEGVFLKIPLSGLPQNVDISKISELIKQPYQELFPITVKKF
ncbi:MAG: WG repeat-containing protein [Silvanigrellaceae bacterium]|nr:WG repeat-containing protein [Silvanigrellaceae bacterium]